MVHDSKFFLLEKVSVTLVRDLLCVGPKVITHGNVLVGRYSSTLSKVSLGDLTCWTAILKPMISTPTTRVGSAFTDSTPPSPLACHRAGCAVYPIRSPLGISYS